MFTKRGDENDNPFNQDNKEQKCQQFLRQYFGYNSFRQNQLEAILTTIDGNDSLVVMATGSGKSLCYQIPPIYCKKPAIVLSPLISLIQNQVNSLLAKGIQAIAFTGASNATYRDSVEAFQNNMYSVIYLTPEGLDNRMKNIIKLNNTHGISCFAIDESHCVSEWGHDFRPCYKKLFKLRETCPNVPILALTATATKQVQNEIISSLRLGQSGHSLNRFVSTFNRPNLDYTFKEKTGPQTDLCFNRNKMFYASGSTIIYCLRQKECENIAESLNKYGINARAYHAGMSNNVRENIQNEWEMNRVQCIVATIAFGMGIDKPDIRYIIHYGCPSSIEAYYQHTGRAGRDGQPSHCILFYGSGDFENVTYHARNSDPAQKERMLRQCNLMKRFTYSRQCRVKYVLNHFGEQIGECMTRCDNCRKRKESKGKIDEKKDYTQQSRLLVAACKETGQCFGIGTIAAFLRGKDVKKTQKIKHQRTFGKMDKYSEAFIKALARKLVEFEFLKEEIASFGGGYGSNSRRTMSYKTHKLTPKGLQLWRGQCSVPPWIPDEDMVKAEKRAATKVVASTKYKYAGSKTSTPSNKSTTASSTKWTFKASTNVNRKRSYSQISTTAETKSSKSNIFSQRGSASTKRQKLNNLNAFKFGSNHDENENVKTIHVSAESIVNLTSSNQQTPKSESTPNPSINLLKEKLLHFRKKLSMKHGLHTIQVISNEVMELLNECRPSSLENLQQIANGHLLNNKFGLMFTTYIKKFCQQNELSTDLNVKQKESENKAETPEIEDVNIPISIPPKCNQEFEMNIPQITGQSKEIYKQFESGQSIGEISKQRTISRSTIENCLADMILNGYKMDWNRFSFSVQQITVCFNALSSLGVTTGTDKIRNFNATELSQFSDAQINLLIARYIMENFEKPKSKKHGAKWYLEDDEKLWRMRDECIIDLSKAFERTKGSIMGRLNNLKNPEHKSHIRLAAKFGHSFGKSIVHCNHLHSVPDELSNEGDKEWSVEEDVCLYNNRDCPISILIDHFGVKFNVISERLMDLSGVDETARMRMLSVKNDDVQTTDNDVEMVDIAHEDDDDENGHFFCKITQELMIDPVILCDGQSYERRAIEEWLQNNDTSPNTGKKLETKRMTPNYSLKAAIEKYKKERTSKQSKETQSPAPSIMDIVTGSGANGVCLAELTQILNKPSSEILSKLESLMADFLIFVKDHRYYCF